MRGFFITLAATAALTIPVGVAMAQGNDTVPVGPTTDCVEPIRDHDRDRDRIQDSVDGDHAALQDRVQLMLHTQDCDGCDQEHLQTHERAQLQDHDGTADGEQVRTTTRTQLQVAESDTAGAGTAVRNGR